MDKLTIQKEVKDILKKIRPNYKIDSDSDIGDLSSRYIVAVNPEHYYMIGDSEIYPTAIRIRISDHGGSWRYADQVRLEIDSEAHNCLDDIEQRINNFEKDRITDFKSSVNENSTGSKRNLAAKIK